MRLPPFSRLLAVLVLVTGGAALAQRRQLQDFQGDGMESQQERDAARSRPKYNITSYGRDVKIKEEPIPWMAIGFVGIIFAGVAPFAWRAYRNTTKEMAEANVFGVSSSREGEEEQQ
ncbi:hypothetical protein [Archangium lipolyticum]|uniref:hypothetical protein n=1 Tax=Archangium lipolyticum TaxID=2970465 RepID=UPI00214A2D22|nr:hypothetical protein [Archangium lipolyticum]